MTGKPAQTLSSDHRTPGPSVATSALVEVSGISKSFGGLRAVNDCSLRIERGSVTALIGPNGAGKSTLFAIMAGAIKPDAGRVLLEGEDVTGLAPHRLFHKGIVRTFQIPQEFSRMSLRENLMLVPAGQKGESLWAAWTRWGKVRDEEERLRSQADEVLDFLSLAHLADQAAGSLSGGQKKLLELGRTMMTEAKLVLLDEPGAGVNRTLLGKIAESIETLNRERGYSFCIIEHDMDLIARLCHPVIVMAQGSVIAQGAMAEIRAHGQVREAYLGGGA